MDMQETSWQSFTQTGSVDAYLQYKKAEPANNMEKPAQQQQQTEQK
jgi:hypothetical protein